MKSTIYVTFLGKAVRRVYTDGEHRLFIKKNGEWLRIDGTELDDRIIVR